MVILIARQIRIAIRRNLNMKSDADIGRLHHIPTAFTSIVLAVPFTDHLICRWWLSVVIHALASINVVNRHRAWLLLGWVTACTQVN